MTDITDTIRARARLIEITAAAIWDSGHPTIPWASGHIPGRLRDWYRRRANIVIHRQAKAQL